MENPYSYHGTAGSWNKDRLHQAFTDAEVIEVEHVEQKKTSMLPPIALNSGANPSGSMTYAPYDFTATHQSSEDGPSVIMVTKVGLLNRKGTLPCYA